MRKLLTYALRMQALYPPEADRTRDTELDRAVQRYDRDTVDKAVEDSLADGVPTAWSTALEEGMVDMQRALLATQEVDKNVQFRLMEERHQVIADPYVRAVVKQVAHYSPTRGDPENYNLAVPGISCESLTEYRQQRQAASRGLKFNYEEVGDPNAIEKNVDPIALGNVHYRWKLYAPEIHRVRNREFGKFASGRLKVMAAENKKPEQIAAVTPLHTLGLDLLVKTKYGARNSVVRSYDPCATTSHVRMAVQDPVMLEPKQLADFLMNGEGDEKAYFGDSQKACFMFVRPSEEEIAEIVRSPAQARKLRALTSGTIKEEEIDSSLIFSLLLYGLTDTLQALQPAIDKLAQNQVKELLDFRSIEQGAPALFYKMGDGDAVTVRKYGDLLRLVAAGERADLLAAKSAKGTPGLFMAMQEGQPESIAEFGPLLKLVPGDRHQELLAAESGEGLPALGAALHFGRPESVEAYDRLISQFPHVDAEELIEAKDQEGNMGLQGALENGHAPAMKPYGALLQKISPARRAMVLTASAQALTAAINDRHVDAIGCYLDLCEDLARHVNRERRVALHDAILDRCTYRTAAGRFTTPEFVRLNASHPEICRRLDAVLTHLRPVSSYKAGQALPPSDSELAKFMGRTARLGLIEQQLKRKFPDELDELSEHSDPMVSSAARMELDERDKRLRGPEGGTHQG